MQLARAVICLVAFGSSLGFRSRRDNKVDTDQEPAGLQVETLQALNGSAEDGVQFIYDTCDLSQGDCPISDMTRLTFVYTGDTNTQCFNGDPYAFAVHPGDSDKLIMHFAGGGACWKRKYGEGLIINPDPDETTMLCFQWLAVGKLGTAHGLGAFQYWRRGNVFKGYSTVTAIYCGGGAHVANSSFTTSKQTYRQTDYFNVKATRDWTLNNFGRLSSFVVIGVSAGSMGSAFWANDLFSKFKYDKAAMIWDSYAGVFPDGIQPVQLAAWGVCTIPILSAESKRLCEAGQLTLQYVAEEAIRTWPSVKFASLQSKGDIIQRLFYNRVATSLLGQDLSISAEELEAKANAFFEKYRQYPNYEDYQVEGPMHCYTVLPNYYTSSHSGFLSSFPPGRLNLWLGKFISIPVDSDTIPPEGVPPPDYELPPVEPDYTIR